VRCFIRKKQIVTLVTALVSIQQGSDFRNTFSFGAGSDCRGALCFGEDSNCRGPSALVQARNVGTCSALPQAHLGGDHGREELPSQELAGGFNVHVGWDHVTHQHLATRGPRDSVDQGLMYPCISSIDRGRAVGFSDSLYATKKRCVGLKVSYITLFVIKVQIKRRPRKLTQSQTGARADGG
jgi:hypothetical protein